MKKIVSSPKRSAIDAIAEITEIFRQSSQTKEQYSVNLDLRNAFDAKNHQLLLLKMDLYRVKRIVRR